MEIHDDFIPEETYASFLAKMPEVCVEIVLEYEDRVLVAQRTNAPAKGEWFWPGGRLYKGEETTEAAHRVAHDELGIDIEIIDLLGVFSHFWSTSAVGDRPSRHTVNIVYQVQPANINFEISLNAEHKDYRFISDLTPELHEYVRKYINENDLLT